MVTSPVRLRDLVLAEAGRRGFTCAGIAPIAPDPPEFAAYLRWLENNYHGEMAYLAAPHQLAGRRDPRTLLPSARSGVVVAASYYRGSSEQQTQRGTVARYARGPDYHLLLKERLNQLAAIIEATSRAEVRVCVDSAPLLERAHAVAAGLGFIGKNSMLIAPGIGSYLVLGLLLVGCEIEPTSSPPRPSCGQCRACLDACPTGALVGPHLLDARRCLAYLTIEHPGAIPAELRPAIGTAIFGCDRCQDCCPYNHRAPSRSSPFGELGQESSLAAVDLVELLELGSNPRRRRLAGTPLHRLSRERLHRNLCVAIGNASDPAAIPTLETRLTDPSPLVRAHAAWALGQLGSAKACRRALAGESDLAVAAELRAAIAREG